MFLTINETAYIYICSLFHKRSARSETPHSIFSGRRDIALADGQKIVGRMYLTETAPTLIYNAQTIKTQLSRFFQKVFKIET